MYIADQSEVIQGLFPFTTTMELESVKKLACLQTFFLARFCFCQNPPLPLFPKQITNNKRKVKKFNTLPNFASCFKLRWPLSWRRKRKKPRWPLSPNEEARNSFRTPCSHCQECCQFLLHIRDHVLLVIYNFIIFLYPVYARGKIAKGK